MIDPSMLQQQESTIIASKAAIDVYQGKKGRIPLQYSDKQLFESTFNEYKHQDYSLFQSFLLTIKSASQQVRSEFGKSDVIVRGFQSILRKHKDIWQVDKVNFDLLIDTIDVLALLRIPSELLIKYDLGKSVKNALTKAGKGVDPSYPLLGHAKKTYNQMKLNWVSFMKEAENPKRKVSEDESSVKRQKVVAGPWTIKATEPKDEPMADVVEEEDDFIMRPRRPLENMKSFPKGVLKPILVKKDEEGDEEMADKPKTVKKSVGFDMRKNAIKRIDKVARHDKKTLYSERGEASRALKQKIRIEWRTPRELELDCTVFERGMESEELRNQINRERATAAAEYASVLSIPPMPREVQDLQLTASHMYNDIQFLKWSATEDRPENSQYYASYILLPQLNLDLLMTGDNLLQLEELKASLNSAMRCPFDTCKAGPNCGFEHEVET